MDLGSNTDNYSTERDQTLDSAMYAIHAANTLSEMSTMAQSWQLLVLLMEGTLNGKYQSWTNHKLLPNQRDRPPAKRPKGRPPKGVPKRPAPTNTDPPLPTRTHCPESVNGGNPPKVTLRILLENYHHYIHEIFYRACPEGISAIPCRLGPLVCRYCRTVKKLSRNHASSLDYIADALNCFPTQIAASLPHLAMDSHTASCCHPLLLDTLQPVQTTGDGNCAFNAISDWQRAVCTTPSTPCCTAVYCTAVKLQTLSCGGGHFHITQTSPCSVPCCLWLPIFTGWPSSTAHIQ